MGCACGGRQSIEENLRDFLNDLSISNIKITEFKKNLQEFLKTENIRDKQKFQLEFLDPLLENKIDKFKVLRETYNNYIYKIKDKNIPFFILSLAFLTDTVNPDTLFNHFELILFDTLPDELTKNMKSRNNIYVLKKFLKYYIRLISQLLIEAYSYSYTIEEDKVHLDDLKDMYNDVYIYEYIERLFKEEKVEVDHEEEHEHEHFTEKTKEFTLERFFLVQYDNLKHSTIRSKLSDIYSTVDKTSLKTHNISSDFSDFCEVDEEDYETAIKKSEESFEKIEIKENKEIDPNLAREVELVRSARARKINSITRGFLMRKLFREKLKPDLEKQTLRVHDYIKNNFTSITIKKSEGKRKIFYSKEGWKKFYPEETKFFNVNYGETHETKFSVFKDAEYYSGSMNLKNQKHGFGISIERQGNKYTGFFFENMYHGWGELIDKHGNIFHGPFKYGILTGKGEKYSMDDVHYIGEFENGVKQGEGQEESEYYSYVGSYRKDKKNNKGKIFLKLLKDTYEGEFLDDSITGYGVYKWSNNNIYKGQFLNGKMHGTGVNEWPDGTIYEGEYLNGIKEGYGKYTKSSGKIYEGYLKKGKPHGKGKLTTAKGSFEVEFENGKIKKNVNEDNGVLFDENNIF